MSSYGAQENADKLSVIYKIFLLVLVSSLAFAGAPTTKLHLFRHLYAGEETKTFTEKNPGMGVELITTSREEHFNYFTKGRLTSVAGKQKFDDSGTKRQSDFTYYQSTFELGGSFYPFPRKSKSMNIYVGAAGLISYNYISLESTSFTKIKPTYQTMSFGYEALMGIEWFLSDSASWCLSLEFAQRTETLKFIEQSKYDLGGFTTSIGIGW